MWLKDCWTEVNLLVLMFGTRSFMVSYYFHFGAGLIVLNIRLFCHVWLLMSLTGFLIASDTSIPLHLHSTGSQDRKSYLLYLCSLPLDHWWGLVSHGSVVLIHLCDLSMWSFFAEIRIKSPLKTLKICKKKFEFVLSWCILFLRKVAGHRMKGLFFACFELWKPVCMGTKWVVKQHSEDMLGREAKMLNFLKIGSNILKIVCRDIVNNLW